MHIDPYILTFSALTVIATIWMGFWSAKKSKTASDFFVAGRSVSVGWNASAISGEYLSAASFMGVAGMVMSSGYDALWYPVCYACGYLFLLLFIAGPLRRFGAYTIPDFAEGRFDSPMFRKIAVVFVLFIGFFYTMPQMKGAGTTLGYIFQDLDFRGTAFAFLAPHEKGEALKGLHYGVGVFLVGAVITLNVALGGMKGITLVQAFQYWLKMFAISVPIFVLMAVYGNYGKQLGGNDGRRIPGRQIMPNVELAEPNGQAESLATSNAASTDSNQIQAPILTLELPPGPRVSYESAPISKDFGPIKTTARLTSAGPTGTVSVAGLKAPLPSFVAAKLFPMGESDLFEAQSGTMRFPLPAKAPTDSTWLSPFGPLTTKAAKAAAAALTNNARFIGSIPLRADLAPDTKMTVNMSETNLTQALATYAELTGRTLVPRDRSLVGRIDDFLGGRLSRWNLIKAAPQTPSGVFYHRDGPFSAIEVKERLEALFKASGIVVVPEGAKSFRVLREGDSIAALQAAGVVVTNIPLKAGASTNADWTVRMNNAPTEQALVTYEKLTDRKLLPANSELLEKLDGVLKGQLRKMRLLKPLIVPGSPITYHTARPLAAADLKKELEAVFATNGIALVAVGERYFQAVPAPALERIKEAVAKEHQASLTRSERRYALLYTYSLIIALVCGTAGLPHILVRFYTNPDGVAAKRTTMWVMILIGVFYLFPPVFGVMGRNLLPELYAGAGAKGTDKVVLELPRILNERQSANSQSPSASTDSSLRIENLELRNASLKKRGIPWGSIFSGITCAGAFAAFMSTFSGLLVSLTGALAHDVYGRMLNPKSTPDQRMRMFKVCAVLCGGGAILLGFLVEKFEINKMVGWAFAIAATSYFPLLFLSTWWRGVTMKGAATGMLAGGTLSLVAIASTMFADQAPWARGLADYYAGHPLLRILAEQPAIWALPLALLLMFFVSRLTKAEVPSDIRMKMLVLHAPERLGLKQEYIQEHQQGL